PSDETRGAAIAAMPVGFCRAAERYDDLPGVEARVRASFGAAVRSHDDVASCIGEMVLTQLYARARDRERVRALLGAVTRHPLFDRLTEPAWLALLVDAVHLLGDVSLAERLQPVLI